MWATWANLGPRQGQTCAQIGPTSDHNNNHNHHHNPRRRRQRRQQQQKTTTTTTTTTTRRTTTTTLPEAFGGNRRLYTAAAPAADRLCPIRVHPRSTIIVVIYSVFCVWCSKNLVFYRVLWPSPSPGFISATLKNHGFFKVLGLRKGSGREN